MALGGPSQVIESLIKNDIPIYTSLCKTVVKSINTISNFDKNELNDSLKNFKKINGIMPLYLTMMDQIMDSFTTRSNPNNNLQELLGYYEQQEIKDSQGKVVQAKKTGYAIIDTTSQLSNLIKNIVSSIESLTNPKLFGFGKIPIIKFNIKRIGKVLRSLCNDLISSLNDVNIDPRSISILLGDGEIIEQSNDILKETNLSNEKVFENFIDMSKTITRKPKMGIIDGISTILSLIKNIIEMDFGFKKIIKFHIKVLVLRNMWKYLITDMFNVFNPNTIESTDKILSIIVGNDNKEDAFIYKLAKFLNESKKLTEILANTSIMALPKSLSLIYLVDLLIDIINKYKIIIDIDLTPLIDYGKNLNKFLDSIKNTTNTINEIYKSFPNFVQVKLFTLGIRRFNKIIQSLNNLFKDKNGNPLNIDSQLLLKKIDSLKDIFNNLKQVFIEVTLCGLLAGPVAIACLLLSIVIWPIVKLVNFIGNELSKLKMVALQKDMSSLVIILGIMGVALVVLAGLAIVTKLVVNAGLWIMGAFVLMVGVLFVIWGISEVLNQIQWVKMSIEMISLLLILGLIVSAIGVLYLLSLVTEKLEGKWEQLFIALRAISVVLVIIIGFGFLLGIIGGLMAMSVIGFGAILAMVVMITTIIASLNEIANAEIKKDDIQSKLKIIGSIIAGEGNEDEWTLKYFINNLGKGWRNGKNKTKKIRKIVDNIKEIVDNLNEIGKYTLNTTSITNNLQTVYDVVTGTLAPEIVDGKETGNYKVSGLIGFIDTLNGSIKKQKTLRKANQSLRKLRRTTNIIKDMCDNLNEIMKFNIKPDAIGEQLEKIWTVIGKVQEKINEMMKTDDQTQETMTRIQRREERRRMRHERKKMRIGNQTLGKVDAVLEEIASIVDSVNSIKDFKVESSDVETKMDDIFAVINTIQTQIDTKLNIANNPSDKLKYLTQLGEAFSTFSIVQDDTEESTKFMGNIGTFIEKINTIDNTEITKTRDIFKDMVKSVKDLNDNFEKLSKTMDKDIAKSLEKMNEQLEKSGGMFNAGVQTTSQTSTTSQTQPTDQSNMDNTLKAQLAQQLANDSETLGYMEEIVRLLKTNKFRVITT